MKAIATFLAVALAGAASPTMAKSIVYVPTGSVDGILVIDAAKDRIVGTIGGVEAVHGLASTPDGRFLVAGSFSETEVGEAALPPKPEGMSEAVHRSHHAAPAGDTAAGRKAVSFVSLIRTAEGTVTHRIKVPGAVHHTAVAPDGRHAVATHPNGGGISVIDLVGFKVLKAMATGPVPNYAVFRADGKRVYVSNAGNDTISEIDTEGWIVRRTLAVGKSPEHMVLSADGRTLYVNNVDAGTVSVVSLERGETVGTYAVGGELHGIDLSGDGKTLFVSGREENKLVAIDLGGGPTRSAPLAPSPYHLTVIRGAGKLYVSSAEEPKIWVIDQRSLRRRGEINITGEGHQMAVVNR